MEIVISLDDSVYKHIVEHSQGKRDFICASDCVKIFESIKNGTPQEPRWIPVSERLPKVADCYAVIEQIGSDLIVKACYFDGRNNWHDDNWINDERNYLTDIVAWMPLPEPYKAESEG